MIKTYINVFLMLAASWSVYGFCQRDFVLPLIGGVIVLGSLFIRNEKQFAFFGHMPARAILLISFVLGLLWRNVAPIPDDANSPFITFTSGLQSASIIAAICVALRPMNKTNMYLLVLLAWLTVPLSINVPFSNDMFLAFAAFCFIAIAVVIINTMHAPSNKIYTRRYAWHYVLFSILLISVTTLMFFIVSTSVIVLETAFFNTMNSFLPRSYTNFLNISPNLNLTTPGASAMDRRPIMEVSMPGQRFVYLKMQVFDQYHNGTWFENKNIRKIPIPDILPTGFYVGKLTMFAPLKDLVPSPDRVSAINANVRYYKSDDQIIYADDHQTTRMLEFAIAPNTGTPPLTPDYYRRYTLLPTSIGPRLEVMAHAITAGKENPADKAFALMQYFHHNFEYSLNVTFAANDKGLLRMLEEKKPAYCTYFASVMALLLRAEGIPSRVAAGFVTSEIIDAKYNTLLVRVNNAHAWTEALVPVPNPATGKSMLRWQRYDATPPSYTDVIQEKSAVYYAQIIFEKIFLGAMRLKAQLDNMDQRKVKLYGILALVVVIGMGNRKKIIIAIKQWAQKQSTPKNVYMTPDALKAVYRGYEQHLKQKYGETRRPSDTDTDVIARVCEKSPAEAEELKLFIREFHGARFGARSAEKLTIHLNCLLKK